MSFFSSDDPKPPEPEEEREAYRRPPAIHGPSPDEVGTPIAASFVLARSASTAVAVQAIRAYSTGCLFEIAWVTRRTDESASHWRQLHEIAFRRSSVGGADGDRLLLGVVLSDGTTARSNDRFDRRDPGKGPRLVSPGGSGTTGGTERIHGTAEHWLLPLPPAPTMELVCAWPAFGIEESRRTIDTIALREAASRSQWMWPEDADLPGPEDE